MIGHLLRFRLGQVVGLGTAVLVVLGLLISSLLVGRLYVATLPSPLVLFMVSLLLVPTALLALVMQSPLTRASELELSLPLEPRTLLSAKILGELAIGVVAVISLLLGTFLASPSAPPPRMNDLPPVLRLSRLALNFSAAWFLLVGVLNAWERGRSRVRLRPILWVSIASPAALFPFFFLDPTGLLSIAGLFAGAALIGWSVSGTATTFKEARLPERAIRAAGRAAPRTLLGWLGRSMLFSPKPLAWGLAITLGYALGCFSASLNLLVIYACLAASVFTSDSFRLIHPVQHLPIARRQFLAFVLLPSLFWISLGAVAGGYLARFMSKSFTESIRIERVRRSGWLTPAPSALSVQVPYAMWRVSLGSAPSVVGPDGEIHRLGGHSVLWPLPFHAYNPYDAPTGASRRFLAHQFSRAIRDGYGASVSEDAVLAYLDRTPQLPSDADFLPEEARPLWQATLLSPGILLLTIGLWWGAELLHAPAVRPPTNRWRALRQVIPVAVWPCLIAWTVLAPYWGSESSRVLMERVKAFPSSLIPGPDWSHWLVAIALGFVAYVHVESRFARSEVPPGQPTLLEILRRTKGTS